MEKEKMWSDCSKEEHEEVRALSKRVRKLKKYIALGYLSEVGKAYFTKELDREIKQTERKYRNV